METSGCLISHLEVSCQRGHVTVSETIAKNGSFPKMGFRKSIEKVDIVSASCISSCHSTSKNSVFLSFHTLQIQSGPITDHLQTWIVGSILCKNPLKSKFNILDTHQGSFLRYVLSHTAIFCTIPMAPLHLLHRPVPEIGPSRGKRNYDKTKRPFWGEVVWHCYNYSIDFKICWAGSNTFWFCKVYETSHTKWQCLGKGGHDLHYIDLFSH